MKLTAIPAKIYADRLIKRVLSIVQGYSAPTPSSIIAHHPHPALQRRLILPRLLSLHLKLPLRLRLGDQPLKIHLSLHGRTIRNSRPAPNIPPIRLRARRKQRPQHQQVAIPARKMQRRVPLQIRIPHRGLGPARHIGQQDLHRGIVAAATRLHDGVAAADVAARDDARVGLAEEMHGFGVAGGGGEHECGLEVVVERGEVVGAFVAECEEELDDGKVAEGGGEVEVRVGEVFGGGVGVLEEFRMRGDDALDE